MSTTAHVALALLAGSVLVVSSQESDRHAAAEKQLQCPQWIKDQATGACVQASSVPLAGHLYPLGPEFHIAPDGRVGIGTTSPASALDVAGTIRTRQGGIEFPDGTLQTTASPSGPPIDAVGTFYSASITSQPVPIYAFELEVTKLGGTPSFAETRFTRDVDAGTAPMVAAARNATTLSSIEVVLGDLRITFGDARIIAVTTSGGSDLAPREAVSILYETITWEWTGFDPTISNWDLVINSGAGNPAWSSSSPLFVVPDQDAAGHGEIEADSVELDTTSALGPSAVRVVTAIESVTPVLFNGVTHGTTIPTLDAVVRRYDSGAGSDKDALTISVSNAKVELVRIERNGVGALIQTIEYAGTQTTWSIDGGAQTVVW